MRQFSLSRAMGTIVCLFLLASYAQAQDGLSWQSDYAAARRDAANSGRPIVIQIGSEDCVYCRKMEATTFRDVKVIRAMQSQFILLKLDGNRETELVKNLKIQVYPTTVLAGPDGTIHAFVQGYVAADQFQDQLVRTSSIVQLDVKIQRELADARAASEAGQFPVAIANAQRLVMISKGKPSEAKAKQLLEELEATATQEYASANQDARSLTKFAQNYAGSTSAQKAETQLLALRGGDRQQFGLPTLVYPDPAGKPGQLLIAARDFQQAGAYAEALELCEMLKGTSESQQVEQIVNQIQSDPIKLAEATKQVNDRIATRQIALAEAWQKNGKPVEAEKCLETALKICPTGPRAEVARGFLTKLREGLSAIPAVLKRQ